MSNKEKVRKIGLTLIFFSILLCLFFYVTYTGSVLEVKRNLETGLKLASLSLDKEKIKKVNEYILLGKDPSSINSSQDYKDLVVHLNLITSNMTVKIQWSYLIYPATIDQMRKISIHRSESINTDVLSTSCLLSVLTIPFDTNDITTWPGTIFDTKKYPAMLSSIKSDEMITISDLVYDSVYKTWNRGAFIKIKDDKEVIAVLGTEVPLDKELDIAKNSIILGSLYAILFSVFFTFFLESWRSSRKK